MLLCTKVLKSDNQMNARFFYVFYRKNKNHAVAAQLISRVL